MERQLNEKGFESYELTFEGWNGEAFDFEENAKRILDAGEGRPISALGFYGNTLTDGKFRRGIELLNDNFTAKTVTLHGMLSVNMGYAG